MRYVILFIIFLSASLVIAFIRGGYFSFWGLEGIYLSSLIGFFILQLMTFFCFYKNKKNTNDLLTISIILLAVFILEIPVRIMHFGSTISTLGASLMSLLGILSGFIIYKVQSIVTRVVIFILLATFTFWFSYSGYELWMHKITYGTFTGKTQETIHKPIIFQNSMGEEVDIMDYKEKYIVLIFWSSTCNVCISEFSEVQDLYEIIEKIPIVRLYSVFCRLPKRNETYKTGDSIVINKQYYFPTISIDINDSILKEIGVTAFPTTIILNTEGKVVFRGNLKSARVFLYKEITLN